jgi:hypothetical protein
MFYPGNRNFWEVIERSKEMREQRKRKAEQMDIPVTKIGILSQEQLHVMKRKRWLQNTCFCGDLSKYKYHLQHRIVNTCKKVCRVCGDKTPTECGICNVPLHERARTGNAVGRNCYMEWHDECMFGLCRKDIAFFGMSISDWRLPDAAAKQWNIDHYRRLDGGAMPKRSATRGAATTLSVASGTDSQDGVTEDLSSVTWSNVSSQTVASRSTRW